MEDSKEMKVLRLVCISVLVLVFFAFMLIVIIGDFISGEMIGFGRSNSGMSHEIESPESFWLNSYALFGFLAVSAFAGVKLLLIEIKGIKNS